MDTFADYEEVYRKGYQDGYAIGIEKSWNLNTLIARLQAELASRPTLEDIKTWKDRYSQQSTIICQLQQELLSARQEMALIRQRQRQGQQALLRLQQRLEQTTKNTPE